MEEEAPTGRSRRGFRRFGRWLLFLALLPFLAFGLSNLALNSSWVRDWLASKIQAKTTLETKIGGASWSPWNGISVRELRMEQPDVLRPLVSEPLVTISTIRAVPDWKSWLKRQYGFREIHIDSPRVVLPLELVSYFAPPAPTPPAVAAASPPAATSPQLPSPPPAATPPVVAGTTPEHVPTAPTPPAHPPATAPSAAPSTPTEYIHLKNASFALVFSGHKTPLLELQGATGSIPVGGKAADASLSVKAFDLVGYPTSKDLRLPLRWQSPALTFLPIDLKAGTLNAKFAAQFGMLTGLPLYVETVIPPQKPERLTLAEGTSAEVSEIAGSFRFRGSLITPATWQADVIGNAAKPVLTFQGKQTRFDNGRLVTVLRGGTLSCVDARLIGDELSFLGNGTVLSNGKAAAVLRIVAPPETTMSIVNQFFPGLKAPPAFSAMSTPQRAALDIEAFGSIGDLQVRLGKNGPVVGAPIPPATVTPP